MIPTARALWLAAFTLIPAAVALLIPAFAWLVLALDGLLVALVVLDGVLAPGRDALKVTRTVEPIISAGHTSQVTLTLRSANAVQGELRDFVSPGPRVEGHQRRFALRGAQEFHYSLTPSSRGPVTLGPLTVRLEGPLRLAARQHRFELHDEVKVYPDLTALSHEARRLAQQWQPGARRQRTRAEGREFESLRDYRPGDEPRTIDWKATARRGKPLVRRYQPERGQQVVLLLDCGRHMTGELAGRSKLDHAVDAALRLAKVALDEGDLVGVLAFGAGVKLWLPPRKGLPQLRAIGEALYRVQPALEESDLGAAIDTALTRNGRRALVVLLTDLLDSYAARGLILRAAALRPRHLPLVLSLQDEAVHRAATLSPKTDRERFEHFAAARLEGHAESAVRQLRAAGAQVRRGPPATFANAGVSTYLELKARGEL